MMLLLRLTLLLLLTSSPAPASEHILQLAVDSFQSLSSYTTTMRSYGNAEHIIEYSYQKPGYVRMDFIKPHKGAALVYRPDTKRVQLRPFGFSKSLTLSMKPTSRIVRSPSGHRVDESDLGVLLGNARKLAEQGRMEILGEDDKQGHDVFVVEITGNEGSLVDEVHRYVLWIDKDLKLPRAVESYDSKNQLIEGLLLDDLKVDPELGEIFNL